MNRFFLALIGGTILLAGFFFGYLVVKSSLSKPDLNEKPSRSDVNTIRFAGKDWKLVGPCKSTGQIFRLGMTGRWYKTTDEKTRLVELTRGGELAELEGVFERILAVQILRDGRWINHGLHSSWDIDGGRGETEYELGKLHGTQRSWYANGNKRVEREYAMGMLHGRDRMWWPNGNPMYDIENVHGEEKAGGRVWDRDGTPSIIKD